MTAVLIVGANGQLGRELQRASWSGATSLVALTSDQLDITKLENVQRAVAQYQPDVVVNAAAYTAVDAAEDNESLANEVNSMAVANLVKGANSNNALLIHVSTDYVFDGTKRGWYDESDPVSPLGVYGRSKWLGELEAAKANEFVTLRTSWVYSALGNNFVATMLRLARERDEIGVVDDQIGCPTSAADLAASISEIVEAIAEGKMESPNSLYHLASPEPASWYDVAREVFEASSHGFDGNLRRLTTAEFPTKAARPPNSRLDSSGIGKELGVALPPWRTSLPGVIAELESNVHAR